MTDPQQKQSPRSAAKPKGHFYDPPEKIELVDGLSRMEDGERWVFVGTPEAVVAAGIVPMQLLPGQTGQPTHSVTLRPRGVRFSGPVHRIPGFVKIFRKLDGRLRVVLNMSAEERDKREAERNKREADAAAAGAALLSELPASLVSYCESAMKISGGRWALEQWFNNPEWLEQGDVTHKARMQVLGALKVFDLVEIERRLAKSAMKEAESVISAAKRRDRYE